MQAYYPSTDFPSEWSPVIDDIKCPKQNGGTSLFDCKIPTIKASTPLSVKEAIAKVQDKFDSPADTTFNKLSK